MQEQVRNFQELKIFENEKINKICDELCRLTKTITGKELIICGSMAKVFAGQLPQNYHPKDVDFTVSQWDFRKIKNHLPNTIEGVIMIEKQPQRIILFAGICIEIWASQPENEMKKKCYYQTKIPYLI